jgi:hypothetical protein
MKFDIDKFRKSKQGDEINGIIDSLNGVSKETAISIPEQMFVQNFLPLFLGEVSPDTNLLQTWFGIAGNPYSSVNITGKDGEILYTVPAFFDRGAIELSSADPNAAPITHIVKTTEQLTHIHPKRAEVYFEEQMNRRNLVRSTNPLTARNIKVWSEICQRYNKPLPTYMMEPQPTEEGKATQDTPVENTGLEYGDDLF